MNALIVPPRGAVTVAALARLEDFQLAVGGYIESCPIERAEHRALVVYVNDAGRRLGLPLNPRAARLTGSIVLGPIVVFARGGEEGCDVPDAIVREVETWPDVYIIRDVTTGTTALRFAMRADLVAWIIAGAPDAPPQFEMVFPETGHAMLAVKGGHADRQ